MTSTPYRENEHDPLTAQIEALNQARDALLVKLGLLPQVELLERYISIYFQTTARIVESGDSIHIGTGLHSITAKVGSISFESGSWKERETYITRFLGSDEWVKDDNFQEQAWKNVLTLYLISKKHSVTFCHDQWHLKGPMPDGTQEHSVLRVVLAPDKKP